MNKKMRDLFAKMQTKTEQAKILMSEEGADKELAKSLMDEVESLQKEFEIEKRIFETEKSLGSATAKEVEVEVESTVEEEKEVNQVEQFAKAVKSLIVEGKINKDLVEGVDANGGYTVPVDIMTKIEEYKNVDYALEQDIEVVPVQTFKGARTYQKKGDADVFVDLDENGAITTKLSAPQFERLTYTIQDRAGFMPLSNNLVEDSDENIMDVVAKWIAKSDVNTTNAKILEKLATKSQVAFDGIDGIKKALNVTLGQAYKVGAKIYTNDDGLNYLDTLKDNNGRPLLNPDPTSPASLTLRCGTTVLPIRVIPNKVLATKVNKVPFIVGNLADFMRKWDRKSLTLKASDVATIGDFNAFAMNMTVVRAIVRDDYSVKDADSIVNGYIDISVAAAATTATK